MLLLAQNTTQSKHCVDNNSLLLCLLIIIFVALLTLTISVSACMYMYVCECVCVIVSVYVCLSMSVYVCVTVLSVCLSEVHTPIGVFIRRSACPYCFFFGLPVCLSIVGSVHELFLFFRIAKETKHSPHSFRLLHSRNPLNSRMRLSRPLPSGLLLNIPFL